MIPIARGSAPTMVEVLYRAAERGYRGDSKSLYSDLQALGLRIEPFLDEDVLRAAHLIASSRTSQPRTNLSLGDGLCIAVAERLDLLLSGNDQLWETLDLNVRFLPYR